MIKTMLLWQAGASACLALIACEARANLLANPGFESPITSDGPPFVGSWEGFTGGAGALSQTTNEIPRSGAQHLDLAINNTNNTFAGVFQDVPGLSPGQTGYFQGWHRTISSPLDLDVEVRIEWRNSVSNMEVSRTPNSMPVPTMQYLPFTLTAVVPVGADTARVVYAVQTFSGGPTDNGVVFVDDVSFTVPEPANILLLGTAIAAFVSRRRRI